MKRELNFFDMALADDRFDSEFNRPGRIVALPRAESVGSSSIVPIPSIEVKNQETARYVGFPHMPRGSMRIVPPPAGIGSAVPGAAAAGGISSVSRPSVGSYEGRALPFLVRMNYTRDAVDSHNTVEIIRTSDAGDRTVTTTTIEASPKVTQFIAWHYAVRWSGGVDLLVALSSAADDDQALRVVSFDLNGNVIRRSSVTDTGSYLATAGTGIISANATFDGTPYVTPFEASGDADELRGVVVQTYDESNGPRGFILYITSKAEGAGRTTLTPIFNVFFNNGYSIDSNTAGTLTDSVVCGCAAGGSDMILGQFNMIKQSSPSSQPRKFRMIRVTPSGATGVSVRSSADLHIPERILVTNWGLMLGGHVRSDDSWWATMLINVNIDTATASINLLATIQYNPKTGAKTEWEAPSGVVSSYHASSRMGLVTREGPSSKQIERLFTVQAMQSPYGLAVRRRDLYASSSDPYACPQTKNAYFPTAWTACDLGMFAYASFDSLSLDQSPVIIVYDLFRDKEIVRIHCGRKADSNPASWALSPEIKQVLRDLRSPYQVVGLEFYETTGSSRSVRLMMSVTQALPYDNTNITTVSQITTMDSREVDLIKFVGRGGKPLV